MQRLVRLRWEEFDEVVVLLIALMLTLMVLEEGYVWHGGVMLLLCFRNFSKRHIDMRIEDSEDGNKWRYTCFYGTPYAQDRDKSWSLLKSLYGTEGILWFAYWDFNEIMYGVEKKRGLPRDERRMEVFQNVLEDCHQMNVGYSENWFTWEIDNLPETNI